MWAYESVFYQIYPIGFCGAPRVNDGVTVPRIRKVSDWAKHIASLGCNAVYFSPTFESDSHGYDTRDFRRVDCRLGTNEDFAAVCKTLHEHSIKVVLDGVFNHVGRGFWAFKDVQEKRAGTGKPSEKAKTKPRRVKRTRRQRRRKSRYLLRQV